MITTNTGFKGRIITVCFPTKSVRIHMPEGQAEWIKCELIEKHNSMTGATDDIATIEELHNRLMKSEEYIDELNAELKEEKSKTAGLVKNLTANRQKLDKYEACFKRIRAEVEKLEY